MKTRAWLNYNTDEGMVEIIIRDSNGGKIENFKFRMNDKKRLKFIAQTLKHKYGLDFTLSKKDRDIDWLKKDFDYI